MNEDAGPAVLTDAGLDVRVAHERASAA